MEIVIEFHNNDDSEMYVLDKMSWNTPLKEALAQMSREIAMPLDTKDYHIRVHRDFRSDSGAKQIGYEPPFAEDLNTGNIHFLKEPVGIVFGFNEVTYGKFILTKSRRSTPYNPPVEENLLTRTAAEIEFDKQLRGFLKD